MYTFQQQTLLPGSVVKVWSRRYGFWHKGMMDRPDPCTGELRVIHSEKGSFVRTTSLADFALGETVYVLWTPQTLEQQHNAINRMHSLDGKPYDLFIANCEHTVNWALTGKSFSEQLSLAAVIALGFATVATAVAVTSRA